MMGNEATNVLELKEMHPCFENEYTGASRPVHGGQTALSHRIRISNPETGYPVSFTYSSHTNVLHTSAEQRVVRAVAEALEQALDVAQRQCGWLGRDFRILSLNEVAPLFNSSKYEFNIADLLRIAESEGKRVRNF